MRLNYTGEERRRVGSRREEAAPLKEQETQATLLQLIASLTS